jgi:hypothetical protein
MSTTNRLIHMVLRGHADKFKTILHEELQERASVIMEEIYRLESGKILQQLDAVIPAPIKEQVISPKTEIKTPKFLPESTYQLRDGGIGILNQTERELVSKLYESLNNDNKERLVKLLSESQESFNKVLKLAKTQAKN